LAFSENAFRQVIKTEIWVRGQHAELVQEVTAEDMAGRKYEAVATEVAAKMALEGKAATSPAAGNVATSPAAGKAATSPAAGNVATSPAAGNVATSAAAGNVATSPAAGKAATSPAAGNVATSSAELTGLRALQLARLRARPLMLSNEFFGDSTRINPPVDSHETT
jgi:hypothetical protein